MQVQFYIITSLDIVLTPAYFTGTYQFRLLGQQQLTC